MVGFLCALFMAALFGFLAGMGVGGGSLLLLWLTQVNGMAQGEARILNLLFFLPAALIATLFRKKQNTLDGKPAAAGILTGCTAALLFSLVSRRIQLELLKKLLGGLLILTGLREVFYRPRKAR